MRVCVFETSLQFNVDITGTLYSDILRHALRSSYNFSFVMRDDVVYSANAQSLFARYRRTALDISRVTKWPGTILLEGEATQMLHKVTSAATAQLLRAGGWFRWMGPDWPEDLVLYDHKKVVAFGVAHEDVGWIDSSAFSSTILQRIKQITSGE